MAKLTLTDISSGYQSTSTQNANNQLIEDAIENTLSRDGTSPNTMGADLDMNSNRVVNLLDAINNQDAVTLAQMLAASSSLTSAAASLVSIIDAGGYFTSDNVEGALQELGADSGGFEYSISALETANGITPTDLSFEWGNVFRYGAVADSASGVQGTDNTTAFQNAVDSGHAVYVPEGWYSIEGTIQVFDDNAADGGINIEMTSATRLERYTNVVTPILHIAGQHHNVNGNGATLAARNFGGFSKGVLLIGPDPAVTAITDASCIPTVSCWIRNFKVIGATANTGWDGSVGVWIESAERKRGQFQTSQGNCYYNNIDNLYVTQFDYCFFVSTDSNANHFNGWTATTYGHAAVQLNGYANQFINFFSELPTQQDTTERAIFALGNKDDGPETGCDSDLTPYTITGITKGATTQFTVSTDPTSTVNVTDKVKITGITDSGAGDLESALNTGHFEVTAVDATSVTVSADTSAVSATWSSGGSLTDGIYPILGARANHIVGGSEIQFDASLRKTRVILCTTPLGTYNVSNIESTYGRNMITLHGTFPGGIGPSGFSTKPYILNNFINCTSSLSEYYRPVNYHGFQFRALDDDSGNSFGTDEFKIYSGRMADLAESTAYNVITIDNVGPTGACMALKLTFAGKEGDTNDQHCGEISWLLPVVGGTQQAAVKYKDFQANEDAKYGTWGITAAAGTDANTGKFTLTLTTGDPTGADNTDIFYTWKVELVTSNLEGTNLDWDNDVTIQNGA